ncbi:Arylsulfatase [Caulifigura coniformis]|uniref:Arylsulfatase n=1 Tax=Caulifigura coniformis TaxID=2527983 RepID=A0A517S8N2_9PLAN|nr:sulfatase-like hydrolase/transferase [Caulifigura coniformis]QDT52480.1 Arylsulfatase [Caulifigura coniformis]
MRAALIVVVWSLGLVVGQAAAADARPNILFLFSDDQNPRTIRCYPQSWEWVETPNIDALARSGVRFEHCYLGAWCMPSRATLLTGRHPHAIESMTMQGVYPGSSYDPEKCPFWPRILRKQGYQTAQIGKWHTGTDAGYGRDWDYQIVWNRPKRASNAGNYYVDQIVDWNGVEKHVDGYSTDNYSQWACDYIRGEGRTADKPWFLWLCYGAIHGPSTPAPRHKGLYRNAPVELPSDILGPRPEKPAYLDRSQAWVKGEDGEIYAGKSGETFGDEAGKRRKTYADFVRQMNECGRALDEGIGQVLTALKESGQLENTLIVFAADQGFGMGEHGFRSKLAPYEATYNSPLIVAQAGKIPAGKVCSSPVTGPDLVQTILKTAGVEVPWKMHGRDLSELLADPERIEAPRVALFEDMGQKYGSECDAIPTDDSIFHGNVPRWIAIRYGRHKYIRTLVAGEMEEIYDLQADPGELTNLALRPEHEELLRSLRAKAVEELRRTESGFVDRLPVTRAMRSDPPAAGKEKS